MPAVVGYGALVAVVMSVFDATGGSLSGFKKDPTIDEYERKEALRANKRRPISETLSELGEGRGMLRGSLDMEEKANAASRYIWSGLRREAERKGEASIWY